MADESRLTGIQKALGQLFQVAFKPGRSGRPTSKLIPLKVTTDPKTGKLRDPEEEVFPSKVQKLFDYWAQKCHDGPLTLNNRMQLYEDMDMLFYNSTLISRAMKLMAEEVVQADSNMKTIGVEAKPDQRKFILDFIDNIGLEDHLYAAALNTIQYGDAGWVLSLSEDGVDEILPIDVYDLIDRIEFTPHEVMKELQSKTSILTKMTSMERLSHLIKSVEETKNNYASYFKSYLFGFQVGDFVVPPWRFIHFRNYTPKSPFAPFGMPYFIHAIAPYRQYDMALSLQVIARGARFPIQVYKLNIPGASTPTDKLDRALEFITEFENSGLREVKKEGIGVGEKMVTIKDLFEYENIVPDIELGRIDDIEMLRDDIVLATGLPRNFLDPNNGSFGNSGVALSQQFKPFARAVYQVQSILLQGVAQLIKIHMVHSGKWKLEDIDFQLTMPYPESQTDRDLISSQSDLLTLANNILDALSTKIVGDPSAQLPVELIRQIYTQILPYDSERVKMWIDTTEKAREEIKKAQEVQDDSSVFEDQGQDLGDEQDQGDQQQENYVRKVKLKHIDLSEMKVREALSHLSEKAIKRMIKETIFEESQSYITNGTLAGKHVFSSRNKSKDFDVKKIVEFRKAQVKRLQETTPGFLETEFSYLPESIEEVEVGISDEQKEQLKTRGTYSTFADLKDIEEFVDPEVLEEEKQRHESGTETQSESGRNHRRFQEKEDQPRRTRGPKRRSERSDS